MKATALWVALLVTMLPVTASVADEPIVGRASVIDGDTIEIRGTRIRLSGIDAPESAQHCRDRSGGAPILCGSRSAFYLADLIGNRTVTCASDGVDRYGRMLAHCRAGDADLGDALVRAGWALSFVRYSHEYDAAEQEARSAGRGMWAFEFEPPWEWRRKNRASTF